MSTRAAMTARVAPSHSVQVDTQVATPSADLAASAYDDRSEMFALMLADIDGRLAAIEQRTDRMLAQAV